jgi:hypothetical protein
MGKESVSGRIHAETVKLPVVATLNAASSGISM